MGKSTRNGHVHVQQLNYQRTRGYINQHFDEENARHRIYVFHHHVESYLDVHPS